MTETPHFYVHPSSFVDDDVVIGDGTKIWHFSHIMSGARIGARCSFGQNVNVGNNVIVGDGCKVQNNVSLYEGVILEEDVFCGPSCVFTNDLNPRAAYPKGREGYHTTLLEKGVTLGANSTVVCGHTLHTQAMVAAGAVVVKDVPAHALVAGVPAQRIAWACTCGEVFRDEDVGADGTWVCPTCGRTLRYRGDGMEECSAESPAAAGEEE